MLDDLLSDDSHDDNDVLGGDAFPGVPSGGEALDGGLLGGGTGDDMVGGDLLGGSGGGGESGSDRVTENREGFFELGTGRFRDPSNGEFEPGSPPPDYGNRSNRYRAKNGQYKTRSADLYDEPEEVRLDALWPEG